MYEPIDVQAIHIPKPLREFFDKQNDLTKKELLLLEGYGFGRLVRVQAKRGKKKIGKREIICPEKITDFFIDFRLDRGDLGKKVFALRNQFDKSSRRNLLGIVKAEIENFCLSAFLSANRFHRFIDFVEEVIHGREFDSFKLMILPMRKDHRLVHVVNGRPQNVWASLRETSVGRCIYVRNSLLRVLRKYGNTGLYNRYLNLPNNASDPEQVKEVLAEIERLIVAEAKVEQSVVEIELLKEKIFFEFMREPSFSLTASDLTPFLRKKLAELKKGIEEGCQLN